MEYKGDYEPGELLCPVTLNWVPLDDNARKMISEKKTRLSG